MTLENWLEPKDIEKLNILENKKVLDVVEEYLTLCKPKKAYVIDDSKEDIDFVRNIAIELGEEEKLAMKGHTIHYDGFFDQARDKANTRVLVPKNETLGKHINTKEREEGLKEVLEILDGCMEGKVVLIRFFCLGPLNSKFSIGALQITDSAYVAHSEDLLYRTGYEEFKRLKGSGDFFYFIHSAGKLTEANVTENVDKRRIYVDLQKNRVFTVNNQYAGNSLGLKKLALRLAINKAINEGWLTEHMFLMGINVPGKDRKTYFSGAYPSACGKTSTAMVSGMSIVGDDIIYIKLDDDKKPRAVNIENGIFGIIKDVNAIDDPFIFKVLLSEREMIFSNVLVGDDKKVYWQGMGKDINIPDEGKNWASSIYGRWKKGMKDKNDKEIAISHGNARYTIRLSDLSNVDSNLQDPNGVILSGIFYGGRDSDTSVPIYESYDWDHGVFIGASIESETTSATLGKEGVRVHSPMANGDFVVVPLGRYIDAHLKFGEKMKNNSPKIFATNYFLRDENNKFFDEKVDKKIWLIWAEGRVNNEYGGIKTPVGIIPKYEDLKSLFKEVFDRDYKKEHYEKEYSIRIKKFLDKLDRIESIYKEEPEVPKKFFSILEAQKKRLLDAKNDYKKEIISPFEFK